MHTTVRPAHPPPPAAASAVLAAAPTADAQAWSTPGSVPLDRDPGPAQSLPQAKSPHGRPPAPAAAAAPTTPPCVEHRDDRSPPAARRSTPPTALARTLT